MKLMNNLLLYVTLVISPEEAKQVRLLIESLRRFGGRLGAYPVLIFFTDMKFSGGFSDLGEIKLLQLELDAIFQQYPLHLQEKLPVSKRVLSLNQLFCMVYEDTTFAESPDKLPNHHCERLQSIPDLLQPLSENWCASNLIIHIQTQNSLRSSRMGFQFCLS